MRARPCALQGSGEHGDTRVGHKQGIDGWTLETQEGTDGSTQEATKARGEADLTKPTQVPP